MSNTKKETYISIDVETAGPNPSSYSLLAIGACTIYEPQEHFYIEIQPLNDQTTTQSMEVSQLSLAELKDRGLSPQDAMYTFSQWIHDVTPRGNQPVFVAFNAPFDWMFVNDYFHRFLGHNPFGHKALDIKAFYMGMTGVSWNETGMRHIARRYPGLPELTHHALQDAQDQAVIFRKLMEAVKRKS
jgi:DNA polymerase III epsilon subunit-like protein